MTTSAGLTNAADIEPDAHPDIKDHQNTDSVDPGYFLGPTAFKFANRGKYTTENNTSLSIVAPVPLYKPKTPLVRISSRVILSADSFVLATFAPKIIQFDLRYCCSGNYYAIKIGSKIIYIELFVT